MRFWKVLFKRNGPLTIIAVGIAMASVKRTSHKQTSTLSHYSISPPRSSKASHIVAVVYFAIMLLLFTEYTRIHKQTAPRAAKHWPKRAERRTPPATATSPSPKKKRGADGAEQPPPPPSEGAELPHPQASLTHLTHTCPCLSIPTSRCEAASKLVHHSTPYLVAATTLLSAHRRPPI